MTRIALDSSTDVCSAALLNEGEVLAERINMTGSNHAALLPAYVRELQACAEERGLHIGGIVLSEGPGSYTGLRIGASLAKGLCYGADIPLSAVPTPAVIVYAALTGHPIFDTAEADRQQSPDHPLPLVCPMIDARRMEVYCALYDTGLHLVRPLAPVVIDEHSFAEVLDKQVIYFCGNGSDKCREVISHPNARWIAGIVPTGRQAGLLVADNSGRGDIIRTIAGKDIAYFEPNYLKDFVAAPSHIKGLH